MRHTVLITKQSTLHTGSPEISDHYNPDQGNLDSIWFGLLSEKSSVQLQPISTLTHLDLHVKHFYFRVSLVNKQSLQLLISGFHYFTIFKNIYKPFKK